MSSRSLTPCLTHPSVEVQCGEVKRAESLFNESSNKDVSMYGAMMKGNHLSFVLITLFRHPFITGYITNDFPNKAIHLFDRIENPNEIVINLLFTACAHPESEAALIVVQKVSSKMPQSFYQNIRLVTSLLGALMKCGDVSGGRSLFDSSTTKTLPMYAAMMKGEC